MLLLVPEVLRLALLLADLVNEDLVNEEDAEDEENEELVHPMVLAAQWIEAGYSPEAATGWVSSGIIWPGVAQTLLATELAPPESRRVLPRDLLRPTR